MKPRLLDAFCCQGGATRGYQQAGFYVVGVDINPQPDYIGDDFIQTDAVAFIREHGAWFDFIHASPPCQHNSAPTKGTNRARNAERGVTHPDLIAPTREALLEAGRPWVIENVAGAKLRKDLTLCGEMFGLGVIMHRFFEFSGGAWRVPLPHPKHRGRVRGWRHGIYHDGPYVAAYGKGGGKATVEEMQAAKGIDWTDDHLALREAIPPAYTRHIGSAVMAQLRQAVAS
ncbi:DNA cytosine methyltransferase [Streptosporangium sp. V21-05]|uniref:DNA cytosine methyltransferase n=1 Tax=Streptosporangium sp. V21-05 TaxID=3446115 RepID=UPI003F5300F4